MIDNCLYVAVGGIFAFIDLVMPLATICEILNEFPSCVEGVHDRPDEVRFCYVWVYVVGEGSCRI